MKRVLPKARLMALPALILLSVAAFKLGSVSCKFNGKKVHEAVLKEDLYSLRNAIDQFTQEEGRAPESVDDLVRHGYIPAIPIDPFTKSRMIRQLIYDDLPAPQDTPLKLPQRTPKSKGIVDVRSGSKVICYWLCETHPKLF